MRATLEQAAPRATTSPDLVGCLSFKERENHPGTVNTRFARRVGTGPGTIRSLNPSRQTLEADETMQVVMDTEVWREAG
jgi:hypothetical protein